MNFQDEFCHTLVDKFYKHGLRHVVLSPGSRSTPLSLAFYKHPKIQHVIRLDERSSAFCALGISLVTERPVAIVTSSGTAAIELHPGIVEAELSCVPLIVITADRPYDQYDVGSPQTINQVGIYGNSVKYEFNMPPPSQYDKYMWEDLAIRLIGVATRPNSKGPVHLNVQFREPLIDEDSLKHKYDLIESEKAMKSNCYNWNTLKGNKFDSTKDLDRESSTDKSFNHIIELIKDTVVDTEFGSGLLVAMGPPSMVDPKLLLDVAEKLNWPIFAESRSGIKIDHPNVISYFNLILKTNKLRPCPSLVIVSGSVPTSKLLTTWLYELKKQGTKFIFLDEDFKFQDPQRIADVTVNLGVNKFLKLLIKSLELSYMDNKFLDQLKSLDRLIYSTIESDFSGPGLTSISVSNVLAQCMANCSYLMLSSSMPIRDFEDFSGPLPKSVKVFSNRGANGIDGVLSTGLGIAVGASSNDEEGLPKDVYCLVGDLAFLYDLSSLTLLKLVKTLQITLTIVVFVNNGGGIFNHLPQSRLMDANTFSELFLTPHDLDISAIAKEFKLETRQPDNIDKFKVSIGKDGRKDNIVVIAVKVPMEHETKEVDRLLRRLESFGIRNGNA
jgi:2-succinyl-5-enolpyruvyl-6-hydroxy-3-cyclohexene-1-carboxylate synthase